MSHTPEPWIVQEEKSGRSKAVYIEANDKWIVCRLRGRELAVERANAIRIVECVNGCAGLNPAAYRECVEALRRLSQEYSYLAVQASCRSIKARKGEREVGEAVNHALAHAQEYP